MDHEGTLLCRVLDRPPDLPVSLSPCKKSRDPCPWHGIWSNHTPVATRECTSTGLATPSGKCQAGFAGFPTLFGKSEGQRKDGRHILHVGVNKWRKRLYGCRGRYLGMRNGCPAHSSYGSCRNYMYYVLGFWTIVWQ